MAAPNLDTFKPQSADELLQGILGQLGAVVITDFAAFKKEIEGHLAVLAKKAWKTQLDLAQGALSQADADLALHTQELLLANILAESEFLTYVLAQDVRDGVFKVISAAIKNLTGVQLNF